MRTIDKEIDLENVIKPSVNFESLRGVKRKTSSRVVKPIFIVGSPRSGTTALAKCLGASSDCNTNEESFFLLHLWHVFSDVYRGNNWRSYAPLSEYIGEEDLVDTMRNFADKVFSSLLSKKPGASIYLDHTPWYGSIAPFIDVLYPDARYVHIIRNGAYVVRSLQVSFEQGHSWAGSNIEESTKLWRQMVENCLSIKQEIGDRYFEVRHEDFSYSPNEVLRKLCTDLDITYSDDVTDQSKIAHSAPSRDISLFLNSPRENNTEPVLPNEWTDKSKDNFNSVAKDLMVSLGYYK